MQNIANFMDEQSRVKAWPAKHDLKRQVLEYLATKFELGRFYTEKEVNITLDRWHTFGDYFLLRRSLIEGKYLVRAIDGSRYWRTESDESRDTAAEVEAN